MLGGSRSCSSSARPARGTVHLPRGPRDLRDRPRLEGQCPLGAARASRSAPRRTRPRDRRGGRRRDRGRRPDLAGSRAATGCCWRRRSSSGRAIPVLGYSLENEAATGRSSLTSTSSSISTPRRPVRRMQQVPPPPICAGSRHHPALDPAGLTTSGSTRPLRRMRVFGNPDISVAPGENGQLKEFALDAIFGQPLRYTGIRSAATWCGSSTRRSRLALPPHRQPRLRQHAQSLLAYYFTPLYTKQERRTGDRHLLPPQRGRAPASACHRLRQPGSRVR